MPYGTLALDAISTSGNLAITGNVAVAGNVTATGNITSSRGTVTALISGTAQATTSGTSIDFTGIPSWVKRITVMFNGVSTNTSSTIIIQLGTSSGVENTGYTAQMAGMDTAGATSSQPVLTAGFGVMSTNASHTAFGSLIITNLSGNTWTAMGVTNRTAGTTTAANYMSSGSKALSGTLDKIRLTTVAGTDVFDAGTVNIMYE